MLAECCDVYCVVCTLSPVSTRCGVCKGTLLCEYCWERARERECIDVGCPGCGAAIEDVRALREDEQAVKMNVGDEYGWMSRRGAYLSAMQSRGEPPKKKRRRRTPPPKRERAQTWASAEQLLACTNGNGGITYVCGERALLVSYRCPRTHILIEYSVERVPKNQLSLMHEAQGAWDARELASLNPSLYHLLHFYYGDVDNGVLQMKVDPLY